MAKLLPIMYASALRKGNIIMLECVLIVITDVKLAQDLGLNSVSVATLRLCCFILQVPLPASASIPSALHLRRRHVTCVPLPVLIAVK
jgi:hypothetical protein